MKSTEETSQFHRIKHPLLFSFLMTLLILVFPIVSGTIAAVFTLNELQGRLVQALAFILAGIVGCVIGKSGFGSLKNVGLSNVVIRRYKDYLWFIPLIISEVIPLFAGFKKDLNIPMLVVLAIFTMAVGFAEELYFRGLIAKSLQKKSWIAAIVISSLFFSVGHLSNLLAGANMLDTLLQVAFAFIFGVVAAEIALSGKSLLIPIVWHTIHNFISLITMSNDGELSTKIGVLQGVILIVYGVFLWKKVMPPVENDDI